MWSNSVDISREGIVINPWEQNNIYLDVDEAEDLVVQLQDAIKNFKDRKASIDTYNEKMEQLRLSQGGDK